VRWDIRFLVKSIQLVRLLIAIAGIITPLGLYSIVGPGEKVIPNFQYAEDFSPFGLATPPRSDLEFSRRCYSGLGFMSFPAPCPYTSDNTTVIGTSNGTIKGNFTVTTSVPPIVKEIYSSGTSGFRTTISNYFDIQWRQHTTNIEEDINNGTAYLVGAFRQMESLILNDKVQPVEGLIVDTKVGGLGFRNHTIPTGVAQGGLWEEDLLFLQPETACVNTNLTLDWTVPANVTGGVAENIRLVDRGGFVNLIQKYPQYDRDNAQQNPDLWARAYKAAWINNAMTAAYMNVTNIADKALGIKAFSYLNSTMDKEFPLFVQIGVDYDALGLGTSFGTYLGSSASSISLTGDSLYRNPFNITGDDFSDAGQS
jgi:hypothetical protein